MLLAILAACGGGQDLTQCGNGHLDPGEQCDDGNQDDSDACTAVCQDARCGDGAVHAGVELCDSGNVGTQNCGALGYNPGAGGNPLPNCLATCDGYDVSVCGAQFTPTPVVPTRTTTPTRTSTPTMTPTATLRPDSCGDGLLEPGETCTTCPQDCQPAACVPDGATATFAIAVSASRQPTSAAVELAYRSSVVSIPGSGSDTTVRQRVRFAPPVPASFTVNDLNYALDIDSRRTAGLPTSPNPFATARFDVCTGAPAATIDDVSCVLTNCADAGGVIADCQCAVTLQP
jgi:cysteine-rich repeat protein